MENFIETKHPFKKKGIRVPVVAYNDIVKFIFDELANTADATLTILLRNAEKRLSVYHDISNLVYHVRLDLEANGFIRLTRYNNLCLTAEGLKQKRNLLDANNPNHESISF